MREVAFLSSDEPHSRARDEGESVVEDGEFNKKTFNIRVVVFFFVFFRSK